MHYHRPSLWCTLFNEPSRIYFLFFYRCFMSILLMILSSPGPLDLLSASDSLSYQLSPLGPNLPPFGPWTISTSSPRLLQALFSLSQIPIVLFSFPLIHALSSAKCHILRETFPEWETSSTQPSSELKFHFCSTCSYNHVWEAFWTCHLDEGRDLQGVAFPGPGSVPGPQWALSGHAWLFILIKGPRNCLVIA